MKIDSFRGKYFFLSNFYLTEVDFDGFTFQNNEAAFQAMKTLDRGKRAEFTRLDPSSAKRKGRQVRLRKDWEEVKDQLMYEICLSKFNQNEDLKRKLLQTKGIELIEGNDWGDTYWGVCRGRGQNKLGKILIRVREELE